MYFYNFKVALKFTVAEVQADRGLPPYWYYSDKWYKVKLP